MRTLPLYCVVLLVIAACSSVRSIAPSPPAPGALADDAIEARQRLVRKGRSQFLHCNSCHVVDAAAPEPFGDALGPHLENIVGRAAGTVSGFAYSEELKALELVWDEETLDQWLEQPEGIVPGMCEPFTGMANAEHRKALIAFLKSPPK